MNPEIMKGQIRSLLIAVGSSIAGIFIYKGWISEQQWTAIASSPLAAALVTTAVGFIWSAITHTEKNSVAVVNAIAQQPDSPVKGVVTEATPAGRELAASIPGPLVATAGSVEATRIATR
jgi:hypothetical protein